MLELENTKLQANGNGYSLTATEVKGFGIVFRFTAAGSHEKFPRIIPSRTADKLLCGVVPGDPDFVKRDFSLVGNNRRCLTINEILEKLGVPADMINRYTKDRWQEIHNDVIQLLCPFIPLDRSTVTRFWFPAWVSNGSVFDFWEARLALKRGLERRLQEKKLSREMVNLQAIYSYLRDLKENFADDFFCRWDKAVILDDDSLERKLSLIHTCREIHNFTTRSLKAIEGNFNLKAADKPDEIDRPQGYLKLVAAHVCMSVDAIKEAVALLNEQTKVGTNSDWRAMRKEYGVESGYGPSFVQ